MNIGIIGTGRIGSGLGELWLETGHTVMFGSRDPGKAGVLAGKFGDNANGGSYADAVAFADVLVLAVPWSAVEDVVSALGPLDDKILIEPTNALAGGGIALPNTTSAAEKIAEWANGGRIVKAFNTIYYQRLDARRAPQPVTLPLCGDDAAAKATVAQLGTEIGFDPVDCGDLAVARLIEPLAALWIHLAFAQGLGPELTFRFE